MITIKAPAKINLAIDVLDKREDGYHNIDIVTLPLKLHDNIQIEMYPKKYGTYVTCDDMSVICDESNLVYVAYRAMKDKYHFDKSLRIKIFKRIPIEAGLAGGSADAAAVINGLNKMFKLKMSDKEKIDVAITVGSDVPYCLFNKPMRLTDKGEVLETINVNTDWNVLLVQPSVGLSTKGVYQLADTMEKDKPNISELIKGLETNNDELIEANMKNGLQNAAIYACPEIQNIIDKMRSLGFKKVMMSGSGSTVFALSKDKEKVVSAAKEFNDDTHSVYVTETDCVKKRSIFSKFLNR